jgi:hypothetical protein
MVNKCLLFVFVCLLIGYETNAQTVLWNRNFGGSYSDQSYKILPSSNGGYYLLGGTNSIDHDGVTLHGLIDILLIRVDDAGNKIWVKCFGGSNLDIPRGIIQTNDGNLLIVGESGSYDGDFVGGSPNFEGFLLKVDTGGSILQVKYSYGNRDDVFYDVIEDSVGNVYVAGATASSNILNYHNSDDYYVAKFDSNLNMIWANAYGDIGSDIATKILPYKSGLLVGGESNSFSGQVTGQHGFFNDNWILRIDTGGNFINGKCFGGTDVEFFKDFIIDSLDNIHMVGGTFSPNDGDVQGNHLHQPPSSYSMDLWYCRIDSNIQLLNQMCIGGSEHDRGVRIQKYNGNYLVLAETMSTDYDIICPSLDFNTDFITITDGSFVFDYCIGDFNTDIGTDFVLENDTTVVVLGYSDSPPGNFMNANYGDVDIFFTRIQNGLINALGSHNNPTVTIYIHNGFIYFNDPLSINKVDISITNMHGQQSYFKRDVNVEAGQVAIALNHICYSSGVYNIVVSSSNFYGNIRYIKY